MDPISDGTPPKLDGDFDKDIDDFLRGIAVSRDDTGDQQQALVEPNKAAEEEIKIRKKRAPKLKLDDNLLTSQNGIPRLRRVAKHKLRFKGKGHEFSDMCQLLNTYQLWLDDLYPKAKYRDALTMVEKLGHSKKMQVMRRSWIDDTKPTRREDSPETHENVLMGDVLNPETMRSEEENSRGGTGHDGGERRGSEDWQDAHQGDVPADDELDVLLAEEAAKNAPHAAQSASLRQSRPMFAEDDDEPIDDLDAMLAENAAQKSDRNSSAHIRGNTNAECEEDDLDALLAEDDMRRQTNTPVNSRQDGQSNNDPDFADDEEAMADMNGMW